jgi:hypothetical protein
MVRTSLVVVHRPAVVAVTHWLLGLPFSSWLRRGLDGLLISPLVVSMAAMRSVLHRVMLLLMLTVPPRLQRGTIAWVRMRVRRMLFIGRVHGNSVNLMMPKRPSYAADKSY